MIPQQNNETPVGLAGLQKSGVAVPSQTRNMEHYFNLAKKMSDGQLADILAGKNMSVPQFVAMTEAMGRKQLRQAMQGAQAQQQAQQPSVKDQLLAEEAGLAALPAPNMASMDMAGGGIIAFEDGGRVPTWEEVIAAQKRWEESKTPWYMPTPKASSSDAYAQEYQRLADAFKNKTALSDLIPAAVRQATKDETAAFTETPTTAASTPAASTSTTSAKASTGLPAIDVSQATKFERRANPFAGMSAEQVDYAKLKEQGLGEGLLRLAGGILSKPGAAGYGAGMAALGEQAGLTRKEIAGLKKEARDYDFNIKKAESAFEQGNDELALKYQQAADLNRYHMGMLNKPDAGIAMLNALKNPQNMEVWQQMNLAKRPTDVVSRKDALKEFNDDPRLKRQFGDFETYYNTINNRLISGTLPSGAPVLGKV